MRRVVVRPECLVINVANIQLVFVMSTILDRESIYSVLHLFTSPFLATLDFALNISTQSAILRPYYQVFDSFLLYIIVS